MNTNQKGIEVWASSSNPHHPSAWSPCVTGDSWGARKPKAGWYLITVSFWLCYGWDLIKLRPSCNVSPQASGNWASNWVHLLWTRRSSELVQTGQYQFCSLITKCSSKESRGFKKNLNLIIDLKRSFDLIWFLKLPGQNWNWTLIRGKKWFSKSNKMAGLVCLHKNINAINQRRRKGGGDFTPSADGVTNRRYGLGRKINKSQSPTFIFSPFL